ncbi:helix-turn-helix domain-containing protein [Prescottella subtropica]|uniref:helix-turn-helix domain-containing protein n=1 Tax=Prescottella subtropica TaxID=2545757 RepID=UPI0010F4E807|nr:helix-turn-helix domain-containing protein [Prescottella subtropica]
MAAQPYNIVAELDAEFTEDTADALLEPIADHSGAAGRSELGRTEVVFTIPADSIRQATTTALAILDTYPWPLLSLRVLTTDDFDRLVDALDVPPLLSVAEAADALGVSRQGVLKAIRAHTLPATRVGTVWVLRESVVADRARKGA